MAPELEPESLVPAVPAKAVSDEASPVADGVVPEVTWPGASVVTGRLGTARSTTKVPVRVLGRAAALKADVAGVLMSVASPATAASGARVADAGVELTVDYGKFVGAYGGDWASRLRLVQLPACALSAPSDPDCRTQTPLTTSANDISTQRVTATVTAGSVVALTAGTSGSSGNWSATSLSASASWQVSQQTGSFSWSYPFEMPPTQGGPAPSLALSYDSGSLDGRVATTNNQSSWIGDGWNMDAGFVERNYASCADDATGSANNVGRVSGDLCWKSDNATLALAGHSAELVKDATTGTWRLKEDDGTKVERLTGAPNGDNEGEYWKVTTTDGTQYWFGRGQRPTDTVALNSAWTVPVFGNNPGDPCYQSAFASSACTQAWRWNLDYVVDPSGNSMTYVYATETNNYGRNNNTAVSSYVRGGYLTRIDYGQRQGSEASGSAPQRVTFTVAERCIPSGSVTCDPAQLSSATAGSWPDVPFDLICTSTTSCPSVTGPAFFTRKRLTSVATAVYTGGAYKPVDSWALTQRFPSQDGADAVMWLDSIQRTGTAPGASASLPAVTFTGTQLANRVDTIGDLGPAMYRWRITSVTDELGATTSVAYTPADCTSNDLPASPDSNTRRCFPVVWDPQGSIGPVTEYFHKYLVSGITADSKDAQSLPVETRYAYSGGAAWAYDDSELTPVAQRTWGQFRGYGQVDVSTGATYATQSHVGYRYFRGMNGDHLANGSTRTVLVDGITDAERVSGFLREQIVYDGSTVVSRTVAEPWISGATATSNTGVSALLTGTAVSETHTSAPALPGGERVTRMTTSYDGTYGLPTQVDDAGDLSTGSDDRCTRLTYARNAAANMVETVSRTETVAVACAAAPARPADVVSDSRVFYDGAGYGTAPTRGLATTSQVLDRYESGTPVYVTSSTTGYDANGRPISATDALGATTTTAYTPATGGPVTTVTTSSPDPDGTGPLSAQVSVSNLDATRGVTTSTVDANGKTTTGAYDGLGRLTSVWLPGRALSASASTTYAYQVAVNGYSTVTTKKLGQDGSYLTSVAIHEGLGRTRQTQTQGANRDQATVLVADTTYDSRGLATVVTDAWATAGNPSTTLLLPKIAVPSRTRFTFDGAGRQTVATYDVDQQPKWSTTTSYGGDRVTTVPPTGASPTTTVTDARGNTTSLIRYTTPSLTGPSQTASYDYDKAGRLTQVKDSVGTTWAYQYDLRGRRTQTSDPDRGVSTSTYDDAGRLVTSTDARGVTLWYGYDALGRKIAERRGSATGTLLASWSYDTVAKGQLSGSTRYESGNAYTTTVAGYDNAYQPTGTSLTLPASEGKLAGTYSVGYTYTLDEQVKTAVYGAVGNLPAETVTTYFDQLSLPRWSSGGLGKGTYVADSARSSFGDLLALDLGNTASDWLTWTYEQGTRRLLTQRLERESGTAADLALTYTHDAAGNVTSITDAPTQPGVTGDTQCFVYDGLRRLTTAWTPAAGGCAQTPSVTALGGAAAYWTDYTYDASGNRTATTSHTAAGETTATYAYPATGASQPHALTGVSATSPAGSSTSSFAYDAAGNTTTRQIAGQAAQTLTWDAEGKLASVAAGGSTLESNVYSADGSRIIRRAGSKVTAYLPGGQELTLDTTTSTITGLRYYAFAGQTIAVRNGPGLAAVTTLIPDSQGTALASIANSTDALTRRYTDPFGAPRGTATTAWVGDHGFLNKATDAAIGLTQVGARYLDTALGRFISVDPVMDLADPQQWNAYAYSNNNPVTWSDPTGLMWDGSTAGHRYTHQGAAGGFMESIGAAKQGGGGSAVASPLKIWPVGRPKVSKSMARQYNTALFQAKYIRPPVQSKPLTTDDWHTVVDFVGLAPYFGEAADGANAVWYAADRDWVNAGLSAASMVPWLGWGATAAKAVRRGSHVADAAGGLIPARSVRFTQDSVGSAFRDGASVMDTADNWATAGRAPEGLEPIRIFEREGNIHSLDNRRLFAGQYADVPLPYKWATPEEIAARNQTQVFGGTSVMVRFPGGRESWGWWQP
ncbi:RHS repeat-associated core domain-containing protein [Cellulomonas soli]|uniref:RHS repeat-associated core domain-containing protein n=1 Tax=Cellulomonas soli TaxID=931535 RepID=UPI003F8668E7